MRLQAFLDQLGPIDLTEAQQRIASAVNLRVEALVAHSFQGLSRWQTALRSIANQLEDLERRAKRGRSGQERLSDALAQEPGLDDSEGEGEAGDD